MAKLTAQNVADYFLSLVDEDCGDSISNLKLQKLLYYAQGFNLAMFGENLFDDAIEAWKYGPVVASVYHHYKTQDNNPLPKPDNFDSSIYDERTEQLIKNVYEVYGQFSAWKLASLAHEEDPWKNTQPNGIIKPEEMEKYFSEELLEDG